MKKKDKRKMKDKKKYRWMKHGVHIDDSKTDFDRLTRSTHIIFEIFDLQTRQNNCIFTRFK